MDQNKHYTIERITDKERLAKLPLAYVLVGNGVLRVSKNDFEPLTPYWHKSNITLRMILYAITDLLEARERPYKQLVKNTIENQENFAKYISKIKYRIETDLHEQNKRGLSAMQIYTKTWRNAQNLYQSDYVTAYAKLNNVLLKFVRRKTESNHYVHYIKLTSKGEKVVEILNLGYVF